MLKTPSFQFYPKDWLEYKVIRMSDAAQGVYMRLLCHIWIGTQDQYKIMKDEKYLAKTLGLSVYKLKQNLKEIQNEKDPLLIDDGVYFISKRLKKEKENQDKRRKLTQEAANIRWEEKRKKGMQTHNQMDNQMDNQMVCTSSSSSSSSSLEDKYLSSSGKTPTIEMFTFFENLWKSSHPNSKCLFTAADGKQAKTIWTQCKRDNPGDPMSEFKRRCEKIMAEFYLDNFKALVSFWNTGAKKKKVHPMEDV